MAISHMGAISFGLVHIPVALYTATQDNDIHFNQLCKSDHSRVRYKKTCASCGKSLEESIVRQHMAVLESNDDEFDAPYGDPPGKGGGVMNTQKEQADRQSRRRQNLRT